MFKGQALEGKTAVITGGTAGIGRSIALNFINQGATVYIFGTNAERGEQAAKELKEETGKEVTFVQIDVSCNESVEKAMDEILKTEGNIDILVNNAGITRDGLFMKMSEEDWDKVLNVNLKSVYNTCHALVRPMMKAKKGKIINITSVVGLTGSAGQVNYAASKAGMVGMTKSLAKELAGRNINVNCIAPGFIETRMTGALNDKQKTDILGQIPMKRIGGTEEVASAAVFLASEQSDYITGQVLTVDGGMTM